MAKSYFAQPNIYRLQAIIGMISDGQILIPRFQRPFVWEDEQRLALLDSIARGIPVGSLLVWRTVQHTLATYDRLGPYPVGKPKPGEVRTYLLDGHQRLSSLYGAFREPPPPSEQGSEESEQDDSAHWPIYVNLEMRDTQDNAFTLWKREKPPPITMLPVWKLLNPRQLYDHQKHLYAEGRQDCAEWAEELSVQFKDYQIPVIPLFTENLDQVKESFRRINSQGSAMSEVHMVNALMWTQEFDLNERLAEILEELSTVGWGSIDPQLILDIVKIRAGIDLYKGRPEAIQAAIQSDPLALDRIVDDIKVAVKFLAEKCGIMGPEVLPYKYQLVLLADAARESRGSLNEMPPWLERWFWTTTYGERFTGTTSEQLRREAESIRAAIQESAVFDLLSTVEVRPIRLFKFNSVRGKAFALLLAHQWNANTDTQTLQPNTLLSAAGSRAIPRVLSSKKKIQVKHLPEKLTTHAISINKLFDSIENRWIAAPDQASKLLSRIQRNLNSPQAKALLQSHAIPMEAAEALAEGQYFTFFQLRRQRLLELEREFVERYGMKYIAEG